MLLQQLCISFNHSLLSLFSLLPFSLTHSISQSLSLSLSLIPSYFLSLLFHFSSLAIGMGHFAWRLKWVVCSLAQVVLLRLVKVMAGGMVISLRSIEVVAGCQALVQWWVGFGGCGLLGFVCCGLWCGGVGVGCAIVAVLVQRWWRGSLRLVYQHWLVMAFVGVDAKGHFQESPPSFAMTQEPYIQRHFKERPFDLTTRDKSSELRYGLEKVLGTQTHPTIGLASHYCILCLNPIKPKSTIHLIMHIKQPIIHLIMASKHSSPHKP